MNWSDKRSAHVGHKYSRFLVRQTVWSNLQTHQSLLVVFCLSDSCRLPQRNQLPSLGQDLGNRGGRTVASLWNSCHCKKTPSKDKHLPAPEDPFNPFLRSSSHLSHLFKIYFFTSKCTRRIVCNNTASVTYWSHCAINNKCMGHTMYGSWRTYSRITSFMYKHKLLEFQGWKSVSKLENILNLTSHKKDA